jgi:hypothetical protein
MTYPTKSDWKFDKGISCSEELYIEDGETVGVCFYNLSAAKDENNVLLQWPELLFGQSVIPYRPFSMEVWKRELDLAFGDRTVNALYAGIQNKGPVRFLKYEITEPSNNIAEQLYIFGNAGWPVPLASEKNMMPGLHIIACPEKSEDILCNPEMEMIIKELGCNVQSAAINIYKVPLTLENLKGYLARKESMPKPEIKIEFL